MDKFEKSFWLIAINTFRVDLSAIQMGLFSTRIAHTCHMLWDFEMNDELNAFAFMELSYLSMSANKNPSKSLSWENRHK